MEDEIMENVIEGQEEIKFEFHNTHIMDIDDSNFRGPMITVAGGLQTEFIFMIDFLNKQYKEDSKKLE